MKYQYLFTLQTKRGAEESEVIEYDTKPAEDALEEDFAVWFSDMLSLKGIEGWFEKL